MPYTWTDEQRAAAAARARITRPWAHSTGPRTALGKRISSRNSYKHGHYTFERKVIGWYIRLAAMRLKQLRTYWNYRDQKRENELREKWGYPKPKTPDTMAYYPYFKVHPIQAYVNKQKLAREKKRKKSPEQLIHEYFCSLGGPDD